MKEIPPEQALLVRRSLFLLLLLLVSALFFGLIVRFILACFWAAIFAILFHDIYQWLNKRLRGRRSIAALLTTVFILLAVVVPIGLIGFAVIQESRAFYERIQSGEVTVMAFVRGLEDRIPQLEAFAERHSIDLTDAWLKLQDGIAGFLSTIGKNTLRYTQNVILVVVDFFLMLYLIYFWVRDGKALIASIKNTIPLGNEIEQTLFDKFAYVSKATLKGTVIIAAIQGAIGGILFSILGIPAAILWGVLMALFSLLPVGGSAIVWLPAAVILFVQGDTVSAIVIVLVGALIIGLIDNLLRPLLVARDTKMPDYLILLATLGGLTWFGITGFIIGPVIAALFITTWQIAGVLFGGRD